MALLTTEGHIIEQSHSSIFALPYFGTIDGYSLSCKTRRMARYNSLIGKRVEVNYRAGDILLSSAGVVVADSGESVYLEDRFTQRGNLKTLRIEIPYPCIVHIAEAARVEAPNQATL